MFFAFGWNLKRRKTYLRNISLRLEKSENQTKTTKIKPFSAAFVVNRYTSRSNQNCQQYDKITNIHTFIFESHFCRFLMKNNLVQVDILWIFYWLFMEPFSFMFSKSFSTFSKIMLTAGEASGWNSKHLLPNANWRIAMSLSQQSFFHQFLFFSKRKCVHLRYIYSSFAVTTSRLIQHVVWYIMRKVIDCLHSRNCVDIFRSDTCAKSTNSTSTNSTSQCKHKVCLKYFRKSFVYSCGIYCNWKLLTRHECRIPDWLM